MDGMINVYKEAGYTSHDVVAKLRGILHQKKIGHTGTLDPAATGVLPVCLGKATKVCELLAGKDKTYQAVCRLGVVTDTQDMTGKVLEEYSVKDITQEQVLEAVQSFQGDIMQVPPMYSAIKVGGRKLYELAREGVEIERQPRPVTIARIEILQVNLDQQTFTMEVTCSKGTYIRTLCHDIGQKLGVGAAMENLVRTQVDIFRIEEAVTLTEIESLLREDALQQNIISIDALFPDYRKLQIQEKFAGKLKNGNLLKPGFLDPAAPHGLADGEKVLLYDENGQFKAIYQSNGTDLFVVKMF